MSPGRLVARRFPGSRLRSYEKQLHSRETAALQQTIELLQQEVAFLRYYITGMRSAPEPQAPPVLPGRVADVLMGVNGPYPPSLAEAELRADLAAGHLDRDEFDAAMQALGLNNEID